jgi:hypothetical protein
LPAGGLHSLCHRTSLFPSCLPALQDFTHSRKMIKCTPMNLLFGQFRYKIFLLAKLLEDKNMVQAVDAQLEDFDSLSNKQCALIDITSINALSSNLDFFDVRFITLTEDSVRKHVSRRPSLIHALHVLERMVAYDFIVFDRIGAVRIKGELPVTLRIRQTNVPEKVYKEAAVAVAEDVSKGHVLIDSLIRGQNDPNEFFDGTLKEYLDLVSETYFLGNIASSDASIPMIFYYLELSSQASIPPFLSPGKDEFLKRYQLLASAEVMRAPDFFDQIERDLQAIFTKEGIISKVPLPPLGNHMISQAVKQKTTLLKIAEELHDEPKAIEFRKWLWEIQQALYQGSNHSLKKAHKAIKGYEKALKKWGENFDFKEGVKYQTLTLNLGFSPAKLIEILGISLPDLISVEHEVRVPIPILFKKPLYLAFISSWYDD